MTRRVAILGAGGHARVIADILRLQIEAGAAIEFAGFIGRTENRQSVQLLGTDTDLPGLYAGSALTHLVIGIGTLRGGPSIRTSLEAQIAEIGIPFHTARHPSAIIADSVTIGAGTVIMAGTVVNPGVRLGNHAIVNTRSSIDHDCEVGDHVHIAPGATLSGDVVVGARSLIGVGASCRQGIIIGENVTIGAGAAIVCDIPARSTVVGVPGKISETVV